MERANPFREINTLGIPFFFFLFLYIWTRTSRDKIAYESVWNILITSERQSCSHNKVNIKIMHFLWPVITLRNLVFLLPTRVYLYSSTYSTNSYHISNFSLVFQNFFFSFKSCHFEFNSIFSSKSFLRWSEKCWKQQNYIIIWYFANWIAHIFIIKRNQMRTFQDSSPFYLEMMWKTWGFRSITTWVDLMKKQNPLSSFIFVKYYFLM